MTEIEVDEGLKVRFPGRGAEFLEGVEIGLLVAELATGPLEITRRLRNTAVEQAREVVEGFGYRCMAVAEGGGWTDLLCTRRRARPKLSIVG